MLPHHCIVFGFDGDGEPQLNRRCPGNVGLNVQHIGALHITQQKGGGEGRGRGGGEEGKGRGRGGGRGGRGEGEGRGRGGRGRGGGGGEGEGERKGQGRRGRGGVGEGRGEGTSHSIQQAGTYNTTCIFHTKICIVIYYVQYVIVICRPSLIIQCVCCARVSMCECVQHALLPSNAHSLMCVCVSIGCSTHTDRHSPGACL